MKFSNLLVFLTAVILVSACQTKPWLDLSRCAESPDDLHNSPYQIEVNGRELCVDATLEGVLCDVRLSGIIYLYPELEVQEWEDVPNFLEGCDFTVEPGSIILVGDHNDAPYYNGCSCHEATN